MRDGRQDADDEKRSARRYLARLLLTYDPASKRWWDAARREASGAATSNARARRRLDSYGAFVASVELSLARARGDRAEILVPIGPGGCASLREDTASSGDLAGWVLSRGRRRKRIERGLRLFERLVAPAGT